jgi:NhaA family Na+:H+ antiporter
VCRVASQTAAPLQRLEHALLPFSTFVVLPVFALFNASVRFVGYDFSRFATEPLVIGIFLGLLLGKPIGIGLATFATVRLGVSDLPEGLTWRHVVGGGVLAGIGFTMSLFVANLAFTDLVLLTEARLAILVTSFVAGVLGYLALRFFTGSPEGAGAER